MLRSLVGSEMCIRDRPGGFGTLDELFEVLTLIQTKKITPVPVILMGTEFWAGMKEWITKTMLEDYATISAKDMNLIPITDSPDEVLKYIKDFYTDDPDNALVPNYNL